MKTTIRTILAVVSGLVALALFGWFVWPTEYRYGCLGSPGTWGEYKDPCPVGGRLRVNRWTGTLFMQDLRMGPEGTLVPSGEWRQHSPLCRPGEPSMWSGQSASYGYASCTPETDITWGQNWSDATKPKSTDVQPSATDHEPELGVITKNPSAQGGVSYSRGLYLYSPDTQKEIHIVQVPVGVLKGFSYDHIVSLVPGDTARMIGVYQSVADRNGVINPGEIDFSSLVKLVVVHAKDTSLDGKVVWIPGSYGYDGLKWLLHSAAPLACEASLESKEAIVMTGTSGQSSITIPESQESWFTKGVFGQDTTEFDLAPRHVRIEKEGDHCEAEIDGSPDDLIVKDRWRVKVVKGDF